MITVFTSLFASRLLSDPVIACRMSCLILFTLLLCFDLSFLSLMSDVSLSSSYHAPPRPLPPPPPLVSIDKVNLLQMDKLNNSVDVHQKPTLNGTLNGTSLKYLNMV